MMKGTTRENDVRTNLKLEPLDFVLLRHPIFSYQIYDEIFNSEESLSLKRNWDNTISKLCKLYFESNFFSEAIELASTSLSARLEKWRFDNEVKLNTHQDNKTAFALAKYFNRACNRCTPFGLFSVTRGVSSASSNHIAAFDSERSHKCIRLDGSVIANWSELLQRELRKTDQAFYRMNDSVYFIGPELRYIQTVTANGFRVYKLQSIRATDAVLMVVQFCSTDRLLNDINNHVSEHFPDMRHHDCMRFINQLIELGLLVSAHTDVVISGPSNMANLLFLESRLERNVCSNLQTMFAAKNGQAAQLQDIKSAIVDSGLEFPPKDFVQIDLNHWDFSSEISKDILLKICTQVAEIYPYFEVPTENLIEHFASRFVERYGDRTVSLLEALDDENGITFLRRHELLSR